MKDFIDFIRTQGVIGLAIGFILGGAVSKTVSAIVNDLVNPLIGIILNQFGDLRTMSTSIRGVNVLWGDLISSLIDLVVISAVVYFGVKFLRIEKLDKKKE